jgi:[CysO sulfur-carrier protein]-S-L-cysteine hydrolase
LSIYNFTNHHAKINIFIEENVIEEIFDLTKSNYPNEIGGILLGDIEDVYKVRITDSLIPEKFESSKISFKRFCEDLNRKLKNLFKTYKDTKVYVGEWHSHPDSTSQFSSIDFKSIKEIAENPKIRINTPLLLIVGYKNKCCEMGLYVYIDGEMHLFLCELLK